MKAKFFCLAVILLAAASAFAADWNRSFPVGAQPQLRVQANDASVEVTGSESNTISAQVHTEGVEIGPGGLDVEARQEGNAVILEVGIHDHHLHFNFHRSVHVVVSVPRATALELTTSDGSIALHGTRGRAQLRTSDGSIHVDGFDGTLSGHTSDGSIHASGRFDLLDLRTSDGSMEIEARKGSQMKGEWTLQTSDGSISLRLPDDLSADIDAGTSDGHLQLELPVEISGRLEKNRLHGKLHGGGAALHVHTSDGSITLRGV